MLVYPEGYAQGARVWEMSQLGVGGNPAEDVELVYVAPRASFAWDTCLSTVPTSLSLVLPRAKHKEPGNAEGGTQYLSPELSKGIKHHQMPSKTNGKRL